MTPSQSLAQDLAELDLIVVLRHAPHGSQWVREGLDVALVAAAFGKRVALLFQGDGVLSLLTGQQAGPLGQKGTHPQMAMLEMYDIETLWVSGSALAQRGLMPDDLMLPVRVMDVEDCRAVAHAQLPTLVF
ncbi:sulfurtransferase complex subunit TusC [Salinicola avicenniae]|uniref:sulfurtransferase complex subunit TusC n=1 Tax=Salinicola avicenniae TaxID=2916836 RepID=UPI002073A2E4|nr:MULTISPECIES: sulfurtransferase complex subunit TusC [unclassified Salinicola]